MNKQEIIFQILKITKIDGKPPGMARFSSVTGISKSDWYPKLWLKWSDAIKEAGLTPNLFNKAYDSDFLIEKLIELIRELGHFPIDGEIRNRKKIDSSFPSHNALRQLGPKQEQVKKIISFCTGKADCCDIIEICSNVEKTAREHSNPDEKIESEKLGYVYLIQHGSRREYKIGKTYNPIRREGEIRLELPEKVIPIHTITTDDPSGVESYWHNRFAEKRKEGEWFQLTISDIKAFKRWKRIY